jgi:3-oxoacyl-[acyl-carrier protein] reductase
MSDFLLELSKNAQARRFIENLGLPIPMPQDLSRDWGPAKERPLRDRAVAVYTTPESRIAGRLATALAEAGADPLVEKKEAILEHFRKPGEAFGRPPQTLDLESTDRVYGIVFDATEVRTTAGLRQLYDFLHPLVGRLERCGRIAVVARTMGAETTSEAAAASAAVDGFVRSLAKEVGKAGGTAQLVRVAPGAEDRIAGPVRFLLSERSAYVSGQPIEVNDKARPSVRPVRWTEPLEGKVAVVTGAARGIGEATARQLASQGAKVVCLDRPQDDGPTSRLARELHGGLFLVDVSDANAPDQIADYLKAEFGGVDIVVHNAGITRDKTLKKMSPELWDQAIAVNLTSVQRITERLLGGLLRDEGRIICLSSTSGIAGNMGQTNYAASKAGIIGLVRYFARLLASRGITVNGIAPGFIETRLTAAIPVAIREVGRRLNNLGQGGQPIDVANAIDFLASPGAQGITGQIIRVCGGSMVGA